MIRLMKEVVLDSASLVLKWVLSDINGGRAASYELLASWAYLILE